MGDEMYTEKEVRAREEQAVLKAQMTEFKKLVPEVFARLKSLDDGVHAIPMQIVECRDKMEEDLKEYMHDNFVTDLTLVGFKTEIKSILKQGGAYISGFITAATVTNYLISHTTLFG